MVESKQEGFKNGFFDYRKENIECIPMRLYYEPSFDYTILKTHKGKFEKMGKSAGEERNRYWLVNDDDNKQFYIMYAEVDTYFKFSKETLKKVLYIDDKRVTWYKLANGYIGCHYQDSILYLHQHLKNHRGHGKGQLSVDHINCDKLDNRLTNLRIVSQSVQNENRPRKKRQTN